MTCLTMEQVSLTFGAKRVFDNVDFALNSGEIVCVKTGVLDGGSSLLKLACGLFPPSAGHVAVNGVRLQEMSEQARFNASCLAFETGGLLSIFTNYNNIAFPMLYHTSLSETAIRDRIVPLAESLGIDSLLPLEPHQLNDVQTRMMNLLRAMVFRPRVLLLDEVQSGMSDEMLAHMLKVLLREQQLHQYAVLMTVTAGDRVDFAHRIVAIEGCNIKEMT